MSPELGCTPLLALARRSTASFPEGVKTNAPGPLAPACAGPPPAPFRIRGLRRRAELAQDAVSYDLFRDPDHVLALTASAVQPG